MLRPLTHPSARAANRRAAFTLLEVLVVVAILVILAGVASISVFRYMEDAKVGRAKADMQALEKAYNTYYTQNGHWPQDILQVVSLLSQGESAMRDPWQNVYEVQIADYVQPDGTEIQRPVFTCRPPGGKPAFQYPER